MKKVSVIILNWNGKSLLRKYLPQVLATTNRDLAEVIVADNGSTDDSLAMLESEFPDVATIRLDSNYGYAEGYNRAIAQVDTPYVLLLNSDVAPAPDWIELLVEFMDNNRDCAACQPKILSDERRDVFEYAGASGGFLDRYGYPYCRGRLFATVETDCGQYDDNADVDWASGAALMVDRKAYIAAGGLDKTFFAHMEEIDLCWRLRSSGRKVCVVPKSSVYHLGGGSLAAGNPQKTYLNFRNNLLLLQKNLPADVSCSILFKRRLLDTLAFGMFLLKFQFKNATAVLRAHRHFSRMRKPYANSPSPRSLPSIISPTPSIVGEYYFKRRKKFSDIVGKPK